MNGRIKWNEQLIEDRIIEVVKGLDIKRMPTAKEMDDFYGNSSLSNKISKTIGFIGWANKLGLSLVKSDTNLGKLGEDIAEKYLISNGYKVTRMAIKYPFDLLVNDNVRVDVKISKLKLIDGYKVNSFGLSKRYPTCDIYILIALDENYTTNRIFIVPSKNLHQLTVSVGEKSTYNKYINKTEYIDIYNNFYKSIH